MYGMATFIKVNNLRYDSFSQKLVGNPNRKKMHIFGFVGIFSTFVRPLLTYYLACIQSLRGGCQV